MHLVLRIIKDFSLSDTVGDFKKFTAHEILKLLRLEKQYDLLDELVMTANYNQDRDIKVWRRSCWPVAIVTEKFFLQKVNYTDFNAEKHDIVNDIEKYPYTSYHNHNCTHNIVLELDNLREML